jgi:hypothetical protein
MDKTPFSVYDFLAYLASGAILIACFDYLGQYGLATRSSISAVLVLYLVIAAYILGQVVSHLSSMFFENTLVFRILGSPMTNLQAAEERKKWRYLFPGFYKTLPKETIVRIKARAISKNMLSQDNGMFYHAFALVTRERDIQQRLDEFRNQYGFARNTSLSLIATGIILVIAKWTGNTHIFWRWPIAAFISGVIMLYRYLKFFRQYTYEILLRYAELAD